MSKIERVTLSGPFDHHGGHGDQITFAAGVHAMPSTLADAARAKGLVEKSEVIATAPKTAVRKATAKPKAAAASKPSAQAPAAPAKPATAPKKKAASRGKA